MSRPTFADWWKSVKEDYDDEALFDKSELYDTAQAAFQDAQRPLLERIAELEAERDAYAASDRIKTANLALFLPLQEPTQ